MAPDEFHDFLKRSQKELLAKHAASHNRTLELVFSEWLALLEPHLTPPAPAETADPALSSADEKLLGAVAGFASDPSDNSAGPVEKAADEIVKGIRRTLGG